MDPEERKSDTKCIRILKERGRRESNSPTSLILFPDSRKDKGEGRVNTNEQQSELTF